MSVFWRVSGTYAPRDVWINFLSIQVDPFELDARYMAVKAAAESKKEPVGNSLKFLIRVTHLYVRGEKADFIISKNRNYENETLTILSYVVFLVVLDYLYSMLSTTMLTKQVAVLLYSS